MEAFVTEAVVVRVVDYRDADRIVTLLTRQRGKVSALAAGARNSTRRFGPGLRLFASGRARLRERPGAELARLEAWEPGRTHIELGSDLAKMAHAGYVCEVARELSAPRHAEPDVYDLLLETLAVLTSAQPACTETLRVFELGLLDAVGLGPVLDRCTICAEGELGRTGQRFDLGRGGLVCGRCHGVGPAFPEAARQALCRARLLRPAQAAQALALDDETNRSCRDALVASIQHQIGRPLRSLDFMAKLAPRLAEVSR